MAKCLVIRDMDIPFWQNGSSLWQNGLFILPKWTIHFAKMDYPVLPNFPILPNVFFQNGIAAYLGKPAFAGDGV